MSVQDVIKEGLHYTPECVRVRLGKNLFIEASELWKKAHEASPDFFPYKLEETGLRERDVPIVLDITLDADLAIFDKPKVER